MERDEVIQKLAAQQSRFTAFGVKSLALFGSTARGESRPDSDVDPLVEFEAPVTFDRYMKFKRFLEDALGCSVDLVTRKGVRPPIAPYVEREAVRVA